MDKREYDLTLQSIERDEKIYKEMFKEREITKAVFLARVIEQKRARQILEEEYKLK